MSGALEDEMARMQKLTRSARREAYVAGFVRAALDKATGELVKTADVDELIAAATEAANEDLFAGPGR